MFAPAWFDRGTTPRCGLPAKKPSKIRAVSEPRGSACMPAHSVGPTSEPRKIATMPCNPAVGGIGKGHLVKEIDALGGEMGVNTDKEAGIQFRILNTRKGPAVRATRVQCDKELYAAIQQGRKPPPNGADPPEIPPTRSPGHRRMQVIALFQSRC